MRTMCAAALVAIATLASQAAGHPAAAASPPRVQGQNCQVLAAQIGGANVWQTTFWAWRFDVFGDREDIFTAPCFSSEANCKAWLYWAQSDWKHSFYQWPPCQKGTR